MADDETRDVVRALSSADLNVNSVKRVTAKAEPVFRVKTDSGLRYVKILRDWNGRALASVVNGFPEIGLPSARLVQAERYMLIMCPAAGWPLSTTLPVYLLPLSWKVAQQQGLLVAMRRIGNRLGRLHTLTSEGFRTPGDDDRRSSNLIHLKNSFCQRLGGEPNQRIQLLFDKLEARRLPACKIHGDPTPHNLFFNPRTGETNMIDFNLHSSVALEDIVIFEVGLELMAERHPLARRSQYFRLVDAFRAGYRETGLHDHLPTNALRALKLGYYCKYLENLRGGADANGVAEHITHLTDPPVVERRIRMLANTGDY